MSILDRFVSPLACNNALHFLGYEYALSLYLIDFDQSGCN